MTSSIKSTALEPDRSLDGDALTLVQRFVRAIPVYGLVMLLVLLALLFSVLLPDTFPTLFNLRSILAVDRNRADEALHQRERVTIERTVGFERGGFDRRCHAVVSMSCS